MWAIPIPDGTWCIDLSITQGEPNFLSVLQAVMGDMEIEKMTMADEIKVENQSLHVQVLDSRDAIPKAYISRELLKKKILDAKAVIRTG